MWIILPLIRPGTGVEHQVDVNMDHVLYTEPYVPESMEGLEDAREYIREQKQRELDALKNAKTILWVTDGGESWPVHSPWTQQQIREERRKQQTIAVTP